MNKKVIRLNEQDIERLVKKIIREGSVNEVGMQDFGKPKSIDSDSGTILKPAIATLKGKDHIVVVDDKNEIIGYGPETKGKGKSEICRIARLLIDEWEEEVTVKELEGRSFNNVRPITFCSK